MPLALLPFEIEVVLKCSVENTYYTSLESTEEYTTYSVKESFQLYSTHSFDVKNNTMCENYQNMSHLKVCSMRLFTVGNLKHCDVKEKGKKGF